MNTKPRFSRHNRANKQTEIKQRNKQTPNKQTNKLTEDWRQSIGVEAKRSTAKAPRGQITPSTIVYVGLYLHLAFLGLLILLAFLGLQRFGPQLRLFLPPLTHDFLRLCLPVEDPPRWWRKAVRVFETRLCQTSSACSP